jgi:PIN domain nuclease of toxin-antitoxin system
VRLLLDTNILRWAASGTPQPPKAASVFLNDPTNTLVFSAANLWEITIKHGLGRHDVRVDPRRLYRIRRESGYVALPVTAHALGVSVLSNIPKDPF